MKPLRRIILRLWEGVVRISPVAAILIVMAAAFCSCQTVNEAWDRGVAATGADTDAPARVEAGKRWVVGIVILDAFGIGVFLPAREVAELAAAGETK